VTYAFLHADWTHLAVNVLWLTVFGSAVARRFGVVRSLLFFAVTAAAGALGHLAAVGTAFVPVIGASAAVSGFTAAALRFVFQAGGPLGAMRAGEGEEAYRVPALGLAAMVRNGPVMGMIAVWIAVNVAFGAINLPMPGFEGQIAWQAHLAGFAAGLFLFRFFDPVPGPPEACCTHSCGLVFAPLEANTSRPGDRGMTRRGGPRRASLRDRRQIMNVKSILDAKGRAVATIAPDATLAAAAHMLAEKRIGAVVVTGRRPFRRRHPVRARHRPLAGRARGGRARPLGGRDHDAQGRHLFGAGFHRSADGEHDRRQVPPPAGGRGRPARRHHLHRRRGEAPPRRDRERGRCAQGAT
jgi:membrane associated rhomboid family serine protease